MTYSEIKVKFVIHKGEVLALFPEEIHSYGTITSYAKMGQHSGASPSLLRCKKAKPDQYYPLLIELRGIYENPLTAGTLIVLKVV